MYDVLNKSKKSVRPPLLICHSVYFSKLKTTCITEDSDAINVNGDIYVLEASGFLTAAS